jgi:hypothetical protein
VTDDDLEAACETIRNQRGEIREYLDGEGVDASNWGTSSFSAAIVMTWDIRPRERRATR